MPIIEALACDGDGRSSALLNYLKLQDLENKILASEQRWHKPPAPIGRGRYGSLACNPAGTASARSRLGAWAYDQLHPRGFLRLVDSYLRKPVMPYLCAGQIAEIKP